MTTAVPSFARLSIAAALLIAAGPSHAAPPAGHGNPGSGNRKVSFEFLAFPDVTFVDSERRLDACFVNHGTADAELVNDSVDNLDHVDVRIPIGSDDGALTDFPMAMTCASLDPAWACDGPVADGQDVVFTMRPAGTVVVEADSATCFRIELIAVNPTVGLAFVEMSQSIDASRATAPLNTIAGVFKTDLPPLRHDDLENVRPGQHHVWPVPFSELAGTATDAQVPDDITILRAAVSGGVDCDGCLTTRQLADGSVSSAEIVDGAVTAAELATGSVTTVAIANGTVTSADLAPNAVTSSTIVDGTIAASDLATGAVTSAAIADGSIAAADLATDAVTGAKILDGSVGSADLAAGAVTGATIADGSVAAADLAPNAVSGSNIADGSIIDADVSPAAAIAGTKVRPDFGNQQVATLGRVGIGTASPQAPLHVVGDVLLTSDADVRIVSASNQTVAALGDDPGGGQLELTTSGGHAGSYRGDSFLLRGTFGSTSLSASNGLFRISKPDGKGIYMNAENTEIRIERADGSQPIVIDGDVDGVGLITTQVLEITGGADVAEPFDVAGGADVVPGTVVCIDPAAPGALRPCDAAYDKTVAGVVSGAGGVRPGLTLKQSGTAGVSGSHPVALAGRVWVLADATRSAVQPGDLLTTSPMPGHAMKADDAESAHGAVLGKAMTSLDRGTGLVLLLVSLQ